MKIAFKYNGKDANGDACTVNDIPPLVDRKIFKAMNKNMVQGSMHLKSGDTITWPDGKTISVPVSGFYSLIFEEASQ